MWTKIQSFFNKEIASKDNTLSETFDHSKIEGGDASQCPFMSKKSKENKENNQKCPVTGRTVEKEEVDSDSEE